MSQATRIGATLGASLILALSACTGAKADTLGVHTVSWHDRGGYNNVNPGLMYRRPHRARHAVAVALLALIAWGVIP